MSLRLAALLCLSGMAACSHNSEAAKDPSYEPGATVASTDPPMQPASLENAGASASPSRTDSDTRAPVVADTKGTKPDDPPSKAPSPTAEPPNAAAAPPAPEPAKPGVAPDNTK